MNRSLLIVLALLAVAAGWLLLGADAAPRLAPQDASKLVAGESGVWPTFCNVSTSDAGTVCITVRSPNGKRPFLRSTPAFVTATRVCRIPTWSTPQYCIEVDVSAKALGYASFGMAALEVHDEGGPIGTCTVRCERTTMGILENGAQLLFGTVGSSCEAVARARLHPDVDRTSTDITFAGDVESMRRWATWEVSDDWDGNPVLTVRVAEGLPSGRYEGSARLRCGTDESSLPVVLHKL